MSGRENIELRQSQNPGLHFVFNHDSKFEVVYNGEVLMIMIHKSPTSKTYGITFQGSRDFVVSRADRPRRKRLVEL